MAESNRMVSGKLGGKKWSVSQPNATTHHLVELEKSRLNPCSGAQRHMVLEVERQVGDHFSVGNPETRPNRHQPQKYSRANRVPNRLLES